MDDNLSTKSSESSITTSGEYEIVNESNFIISLPNEDLQHQEKAAKQQQQQQLMKNNNNNNKKSSMSLMMFVGTDEEINSSSSSSAVGSKSPKLAIGNNRDIADLQYEMHDALRELEITEQKGILTAGTSSPTLIVPERTNSPIKFDMSATLGAAATASGGVAEYAVIGTPRSSENSANSELNRVGHSVFYDCIDGTKMAHNKNVSIVAGLEEKQDTMKPEKSDTDEEVSDIDQGCTIFSGVTYLGAANINSPKSEFDVYRIMSELNSGTTANGLKITISIPNSSEGLVILNDAETSTVIATYEIQSIILYFRGPVETIENGCFAFTWLHGESFFQCHVFRCHIPEAVNQVSACFQKAFQTYPPSMTCSLSSAMDSNMLNSVTSDLSGNPLNTAGYEFIVSLEIKEKVAKNNYTAVPRDRNCFKLRANTDKEVYITVKQTPSTVLQPLFIERCFGVLLSPGKLIRQADMQLIDLVSMGYQQINNNNNNNSNNNNNNNNSNGTTTTTTATTNNNNNNSNINCTSTAAIAATAAATNDSNATSTQAATSSSSSTTTTTGTTVANSNVSITLTNNNNNNLPISLNPYCIRAEWKAQEKAFEQLNNAESNKTFLTVAVDIVMRGIQEPVRFVIESPVIIQSPSELRIMDHFISKRPMIMRFYLHLKRTTDEFSWEVSSIDPSEEILEQNVQHNANTTTSSSSSSYLLKFGMNNLSRIVRSTSIVSIEDDCPTDYSSDGDEPLLSGTGEVSKDCSQDTLDEWDPILKEWDGEKRPKNLPALVRLGVPEALREKIWQKLANVEGKTEMTNMYKTLITKETKCETVIQRDIHRTFPAHKCFKETGGSGQDALFKVSKAYAVYDSEVGYCQGLSFIAASLLLHMPEEDAFCVLVALMYDYGLRDLYKQGFEVLYMRLYQLDRLIKDQLPKLHEHFTACGIETHMYASQWFLTLFTARFPLCFVFHVLDVFLLDGVPLLFQVAITLLSICEADLRQLDFEGILKYFRVTLPKKCRSSSQARRIMKSVCERKIKKLKHYEEEFFIKKQHKERLEKESQIYESRFGEERRKLQSEIDMLLQQLSDLRKCQAEKEKKHTGIIQDYKQIIQRLEQDTSHMNETLTAMMHIVGKCENCAKEIQQLDNTRLNVPANGSGAVAAGHILNNDQINSGSHFSSSSGGYNKNATLGPLDPLNAATLRIRELELELAQAKLAHVEAECRNQDLNHQLNTTMSEINANRNSWQPWLSKTFNTLQEKVTTRVNRETPTFQSYTTAAAGGDSTLTTSSSTLTHNSNQEEKSCSVNVSPKLPPKFQASRIRNSIDSLRSIVPMDMTKINVMCDHNEQPT